MSKISLNSKKFNEIEYTEDVSTAQQVEKYILDLIGQDGDLNAAKIINVVNARATEILSEIGDIQTALDNL
jgi:hypothetical protein